MPRLYFTCKYCDHKWDDLFYSAPTSLRCSICKDRHIKVKQQAETYDVFGYDDDSAKEDAWVNNDD